MKRKYCKECGTTLKAPFGKDFCSSHCYQKDYRRKYKKTPKGRYNMAKKECTRKRCVGKAHKEFKLTLEEYTSLTKDDTCHYCKGNLNSTGLALDRLDNKKPYTIDNCVPCCAKCNNLRGDYLTPEEMKRVVKLLKRVRGGHVWS